MTNAAYIPEKVNICAEGARTRNPEKVVWLRKIGEDDWRVHTHSPHKAKTEMAQALALGHRTFLYSIPTK